MDVKSLVHEALFSGEGFSLKLQEKLFPQLLQRMAACGASGDFKGAWHVAIFLTSQSWYDGVALDVFHMFSNWSNLLHSIASLWKFHAPTGMLDRLACSTDIYAGKKMKNLVSIHPNTVSEYQIEGNCGILGAQTPLIRRECTSTGKSWVLHVVRAQNEESTIFLGLSPS